MTCILKKKIPFFFILLSLLLLSYSNFLSGYEAKTVDTFSIYFPTDSTLGFQNGQKFVLVSSTTGNMNSSEASCYVYDGGGWFKFVSNESVTLKITYNVTNLKLNGNVIMSGASGSFVQNDDVIIEWYITVKPLLPMMFIFGIIGLVSCFAGPLYTINGVKKHGVNQDDFVNGLVVTVIGIALVLAWLW